MEKTEFDLFCDWVKTALPKHQLHSAFQLSLRSLLSAEFPHTTAIPEVYAVAGPIPAVVQVAQTANGGIHFASLFCGQAAFQGSLLDLTKKKFPTINRRARDSEN